MKKRFWLLGMALLAGCAVPKATTSFSLQVKPDINGKNDTYTTQYVSGNIDHLTLKVFSVRDSIETPVLIGGSQLSLDVASSSLNKTLRLGSLHYNTTYRVRAYAYKSPGTAEQISDDASSSLDITVNTDDAMGPHLIPVGLISHTFDAKASSSISVTPGTLTTSPLNITYGLFVKTIAGGGSSYADATGSAAAVSFGHSITADANGNFYYGDYEHRVVRKVTQDGLVSTIAGTAYTFGTADGIGTAATFQGPVGVCLDHSGNLYVADHIASNIRKINLATKQVSTFATNVGTYLVGMACDSQDNIFVTNWGSIRKITPAGAVSTFVGSESATGFKNGTGTAARFGHELWQIAIDDSDNLYVTDVQNYAIRKITPEGVVTTFAGNGTSAYVDGSLASAQFSDLYGITRLPSGGFLVSDGVRLRIISNGRVATVAGSSYGSLDGRGTAARLSMVYALAAAPNGKVGFVNNSYFRLAY